MRNDPVSVEAKIDGNSTDNVLVAGLTGQRIRVFMLFFVQDTDSNVTFKSGSTALTGAMSLTGFGTLTFPFSSHPWFTTELGDDLVLNQSGSAQFSGRIYYSQG